MSRRSLGSVHAQTRLADGQISGIVPSMAGVGGGERQVATDTLAAHVGAYSAGGGRTVEAELPRAPRADEIGDGRSRAQGGQAEHGRAQPTQVKLRPWNCWRKEFSSYNSCSFERTPWTPSSSRERSTFRSCLSPTRKAVLSRSSNGFMRLDKWWGLLRIRLLDGGLAMLSWLVGPTMCISESPP